MRILQKQIQYQKIKHRTIPEALDENDENSSMIAMKQMHLLKQIAEKQYQSLPSLKTDSIFYKHISSKFSLLCINCFGFTRTHRTYLGSI